MAVIKEAGVFVGVLVFWAANYGSVWAFKASPGEHSLGQPWPLPQSFQQTADVQVVSRDSFKFTVSGQTCDILEAALIRYFNIVFYDPLDSTLRFRPRPSNWQNRVTKNAILTSVDVKVQQVCDYTSYPSLEMDESYKLSVSTGSGSLTANSVWGALRGLETFSQIVYGSGEGTYLLNNTEITDAPRFHHRGILLDTSRHFLSKQVILANLDAMAYNKFNVFHWHIVDETSFPYQSRDYPALSAMGAYDPDTHVYTQADVLDIIEYARLQGIRVVPEFDTPGHTGAWGKGQPDLLTKCYSKGVFTGKYGPVDPTVNTTYTFLKGFMKELTEVFPDKYLHLGGDEVSFSCWQSNPDITEFMKKMGYGTDYSKLEQYYEQQLLDIVGSYNSGYIIWQEVVDNGVKVRPDTVVHVWKSNYKKELEKVTNMSLRTLVSSPWYLDYISYGAKKKKVPTATLR